MGKVFCVISVDRVFWGMLFIIVNKGLNIKRNEEELFFMGWVFLRLYI